MTDRACLRCIAKKRRCDHTRPICGSCRKLNLDCEYPPPQARRGPVAGLSKRAEARVQQCENALWYLMNIPEVQDAVRRHADAPLPPAPSARLDRVERAEWWSRHPLMGVDDLLAFAHESDIINTGGGGGGVVGAVGVDSAAPAPPHPHVHHDNGVGNGSTEENGIGGEEYLPQEYQQYHVPADVPRALNSQASRNAMGPSLWQLVSAAIPDEVDVEVGDVVGDGVDVEEGITPITEPTREGEDHTDSEEGRSRRVMSRFGVHSESEEWPYGEERKRKRMRGEVFW